MIRTARVFWLSVLALTLALPARAQDGNVLLPVSEIEKRLREQPFDIFDMRGSRFEDDRTQRVLLGFPDSVLLLVKWAKAPRRGGFTFNNEPRYEAAAYEFQKLFLDERDYVVPPTFIRAVALDFYRKLQPDVAPTFGNASSIIVVLQYWLSQVTGKNVHDDKRFEEDPRYAKYLANTNVFSYLVRHSDSNSGNFLVSTDSANPRVFAVDNGVAFGFASSDRGTDWRELRVKRVPKATIDRLRAVTKEDLKTALGVVAQFQIQADKSLVEVPRTKNISPGLGVRNKDNVVQFGLTEREISDIDRRIRWLIERVDNGKLQTF